MTKPSDYQVSHREQACSFSHMGNCLNDVVGHHIRVSGLCGTGMKPADYLAIPVCHNHHQDCHSLKITQREQEATLMQYWMERLIQEHGRAKAFEMMGTAFFAWLP